MGKSVAPLTRIETVEQAKSFADYLRDQKRTEIVAVMSTAVRETNTRLDAGAAAFKLADLGVRSYVILTGAPTQELSKQIGREQALYGGAVRVYPTGTEWMKNPYVSPLRLGMPGADGRDLTRFLVDAATKLASSRPDEQHEYRSPANGTGNSVGAALSAAMEKAAQERGEATAKSAGAASTPAPSGQSRTAPQPRSAAPEKVAAAPKPSAAAIAATPAVLDSESAEPEPQTSVTVPTLPVPPVGAARPLPEPLSVDVARRGFEAVVEDLARAHREHDALAERMRDEIAAVTERGNAHLRLVVERMAAEHADELAAMDARLRSQAARHAAAVADAEERAAKAEAAAADRTRDVESLTSDLRAAEALARTLARSLQEAEGNVTRAESAANDSAIAIPEDLFEDPDQAVRHGIQLAWVQRIPAADKAAWPLPEYRTSDRFAASVLALSQGHRVKALRAVVDVLTGMGNSVSARAIHPLRASEAPTAPPVTDPSTGAVCMRAAIETRTASARRLHFWKHPDGTIELIRIVLHDDMQP